MILWDLADSCSHLQREPSDRADDMQNWLIDEKKSLWKQIINKEVSSSCEPDVSNYDDLVRHLTSSEGMDQGWAIYSDKKWKDIRPGNIW